jgi:hypothetical protein
LKTGSRCVFPASTAADVSHFCHGASVDFRSTGTKKVHDAQAKQAMTVSGLHLVIDIDRSRTGSSLIQSILAKANYIFKTAFSFWDNAVQVADRRIMKNFNGSDCTFNQHGFISQFKDSEGRAWKFSYLKERVVAFTDPQGRSFTYSSGEFVQDSGQIVDPAARDVSVNHETGDITIVDSLRRTTYRPDGSTEILVEQERDGECVKVCFTEYATRPHRAFVVVEERAGRKQVSWIQDANAKLFKFEYDAAGNLSTYTDVSNKPPVVWSVETMANGKVLSWSGRQKNDGKTVGVMSPMLESVDLCGNRHFVRQDGARFIVGPSGAACMTSHLHDDVLSGRAPIVSVSALANFAPEL